MPRLPALLDHGSLPFNALHPRSIRAIYPESTYDLYGGACFDSEALQFMVETTQLTAITFDQVFRDSASAILMAHVAEEDWLASPEEAPLDHSTPQVGLSAEQVAKVLTTDWHAALGCKLQPVSESDDETQEDPEPLQGERAQLEPFLGTFDEQPLAQQGQNTTHADPTLLIADPEPLVVQDGVDATTDDVEDLPDYGTPLSSAGYTVAPGPSKLAACDICCCYVATIAKCHTNCCLACWRTIAQNGLRSRSVFPPRLDCGLCECSRLITLPELVVHGTRAMILLWRLRFLESLCHPGLQLPCSRCGVNIAPLDTHETYGVCLLCPGNPQTCVCCGDDHHPNVEECVTDKIGMEPEARARLLAEMDENNVFFCPACSVKMERTEACSHMVCICGQELCAVDGLAWGRCPCRLATGNIYETRFLVPNALRLGIRPGAPMAERILMVTMEPYEANLQPCYGDVANFPLADVFDGIWGAKSVTAERPHHRSLPEQREALHLHGPVFEDFARRQRWRVRMDFMIEAYNAEVPTPAGTNPETHPHRVADMPGLMAIFSDAEAALEEVFHPVHSEEHFYHDPAPLSPGILPPELFAFQHPDLEHYLRKTRFGTLSLETIHALFKQRWQDLQAVFEASSVEDEEAQRLLASLHADVDAFMETMEAE